MNPLQVVLSEGITTEVPIGSMVGVCAVGSTDNEPWKIPPSYGRLTIDFV